MMHSRHKARHSLLSLVMKQCFFSALRRLRISLLALTFMQGLARGPYVRL